MHFTSPHEPLAVEGLLPEKYFFVLINPLPEPYELRAFCICAIGESGTGCMTRPRCRAPRHSSSGIRRVGGSRDDGGGGGDPDPGPHLERRPVMVIRFPLHAVPVDLVVKERGGDGWLTVSGSHGWVFGSRDEAHRESRWLAHNRGGLPIRELGRAP
jgi:hypothetical protein